MSQASQHLRSSEKKATCEGYFARQSICSVVSLDSGMSRAEHPQEFSKVDFDHRLVYTLLVIVVATGPSVSSGRVLVVSR